MAQNILTTFGTIGIKEKSPCKSFFYYWGASPHINICV